MLAWSLLVELAGGVTHVNHFVLDSSVFREMAAVLSAPVNWSADGAMLALAAVLATLAVMFFARRDIAGESPRGQPQVVGMAP